DAAGQRAGGRPRQPLRRPPPAARGADRGGGGVPGARPVGRHRRRRLNFHGLSMLALPGRRASMLEGARNMDTNRLATLLRALLARPDEVMLELGAGGELLVARLRAALSALILLLPLVGAVSG